ncbi:MAG: PorT family protein [Tannerellaceae bacterium]|jgi:hypothetical protein|nr:PorT family protein [Tannerellaceae bacterium]
MNKILRTLIAAALLLTSLTAGAQIHLGIKGGLNISSISLSKDIIASYNVTGFHIGPMLEIMTPLGIGVDGAIMYSQKGMEVRTENALMNNYLEVPVNLKYKLGIIPMIQPYIAAGPYVEIRLDGADSKWDHIQSQIETKSFGAGINLGIGCELFERAQIGLTYGLALTDNYSVDKIVYQGINTDINIKRKTISLSAALLF